MHHSLALARNGRFAVVRTEQEGSQLSIVPVTTGAVTTVLPEPAGAFAWMGGQVWWVRRDGRIGRATADGRLVDPVDVGVAGSIEHLIRVADTSVLAIHTGGAATLIGVEGATVTCKPLDGEGTWLAADPSCALLASERGCELRFFGRSRIVKLPVRGEALRAAFLFGGRAVAVWAREAGSEAVIVATPAGQLLHRIELPAALRDCAFAEHAGLAVTVADHELSVIDLRVGNVRGRVPIASAIPALDVDAMGRAVVVTLGDTDVRFMTLDELFVTRPSVEAEPASEPVEVADVNEQPIVDVVPADPEPIVWPRPRVRSPARSIDTSAHLAALLDLVAARTQIAIADADPERARDADQARARLLACAEALEVCTHELLGAGAEPAFTGLARELSLSPVASQLLACAAAPRLRGQIAQLYATLSRLTGHATCSEHFLALLLEPEDGSDLPDVLARELSVEAPLARAGAIAFAYSGTTRTIVVDDIVLDRLRAHEHGVEISSATRRRSSSRSLEDLLAPDSAKQELLLAFEEPERLASLRVLVRGRRGSGRHTLVAAAAAVTGKTIAAVDVKQLEPGTALPAALARELARANLAGAIPVVSGLELFASDAIRPQLEHVLARHPGAVVVRTTVEGDVPFDPDRIEIALPTLDLGQRVIAWQRATARHGLAFSDDAIELLGVKYRFGPGTIERIAEQVARRVPRSRMSPAQLLEQVARQHVTGRLEAVASRVTRLATWDHVTLPEDMRDSVLEFVGRMRCQRKVYEQWGFEERIGTARGLTALFYGPPGTGKTLVAGLIGRELGLDVWRIDLARVMSKWVGETQKKLAEVFDAAEEGQVLLLFDEADSLFAKRKTDGKSGNEHFTNMDTNYLLQRIDSFEGVAIMTTNLEGAIDPAFKRRLTMRLYFPFPDADARARLWSAHVPADVPREGRLDFADLGESFPISGGYIRNCALRAAFLAAQERRPLTHGHLLRALQLEYRELGKLWPSGRME